MNNTKRVMTANGDRIDLICWRHYGTLDGRIVERVLEANPGSSMMNMFPAGIFIVLPEIEPVTLERSLW